MPLRTVQRDILSGGLGDFAHGVSLSPAPTFFIYFYLFSSLDLGFLLMSHTLNVTY